MQITSKKTAYGLLIAAAVLLTAVSAIISTQLIATLYFTNPLYYIPSGLALFALTFFALFIALNVPSKKASAVAFSFYLVAAAVSIATIYLYIALPTIQQKQIDQTADSVAKNGVITRHNGNQDLLISTAKRQISNLQTQNAVSNKLLTEFANGAIKGKYKTRDRANVSLEAKKIAARDTKIKAQQVIISEALAAKKAQLSAQPLSTIPTHFNPWVLLQAAMLDIFALMLQILARFIRQSSIDENQKTIHTIDQSVAKLNAANADAAQTSTLLIRRIQNADQLAAQITTGKKQLETQFNGLKNAIEHADTTWETQNHEAKMQQVALADQTDKATNQLDELAKSNGRAEVHISAMEQLKTALATSATQSSNTAEQARKTVYAAQAELKQDIQTTNELNTQLLETQKQAAGQQTTLNKAIQQSNNANQALHDSITQAGSRINQSKQLSQAALNDMQTHNQRFYKQQSAIEALANKVQQDTLNAAEQARVVIDDAQAELEQDIQTTSELNTQLLETQKQAAKNAQEITTITTQTVEIKELNQPSLVSIEFNEQVNEQAPVSIKSNEQVNEQAPVSIKSNEQESLFIKVNEQESLSIKSNEQANEQASLSIKSNEQANEQESLSIRKSGFSADIVAALEVLKRDEIQESSTGIYTNELISKATKLPYNRIALFKKAAEAIGLMSSKIKGNGRVYFKAQSNNVVLFKSQA